MLRAGFGRVELSVLDRGRADARLRQPRRRRARHPRAAVRARARAGGTAAARRALRARPVRVAGGRRRGRARAVASRGVAPERPLRRRVAHAQRPGRRRRTARAAGGLAGRSSGGRAGVRRLAPARARRRAGGRSTATRSTAAGSRTRSTRPCSPIRVDAEDGAPLGVYFGLACHPVVLGPDNRRRARDWPGVTARVLEERLGRARWRSSSRARARTSTRSRTACRARDRGRRARRRAARAACAYQGGDPARRHDVRRRRPDRRDVRGGRARSAARSRDEALRVHGGTRPPPSSGLWTERIAVPIRRRTARPRAPRSATTSCRARPARRPARGDAGRDRRPRDRARRPAGRGVRAHAASTCASDLRAAGVEHPYVVGYANGWRGYLRRRTPSPTAATRSTGRARPGTRRRCRTRSATRVLEAVAVHAPRRR